MPAPTSEYVTPPLSGASRLVTACAVGAVVFLLTAAIRSTYDFLSGVDVYYHLHIGRSLSLSHPYMEGLPWTRISVFQEHWGDKEWLFHLFLMPFARHGLDGGRWVLCLLNGILAAGLTGLATSLWGRRGLWIVPLCAALSWQFLWRMDLLRPHQFSLLLLLLLLTGLTLARGWMVALAMFLFPLSYTAWHFPLGLGLLTWLAWGVLLKQWDRRLLALLLIPLVAGILLHPGFPDNLAIWKLQNITFWRVKDQLGVGEEINPLGWKYFLLDNLGVWLIGIGGLVLVGHSKPHRSAGRVEWALRIFAGVSVLLYSTGQRFAEYAVPLLALLMMAEFDQRIPVRKSMPWTWRQSLLAGSLVLALAYASVQIQGVVMNSNRYGFKDSAGFGQFGQLLPEDARVFAPWGDTPVYIWAAPHARFINVLDPVFMHAVSPEASGVAALIDQGEMPDVADALDILFDSEYIAFSALRDPGLLMRLQNDPRFMKILDSPPHVLFKIQPEAMALFVTDWMIYGSAQTEYDPFRMEIGGKAPLPLPVRGRLQALVKPPSQTAPDGCWWAYRLNPQPLTRKISFSALGPSWLYLDGQLSLRTDGVEEGLINYRGAVIDYREAAIRTCPGRLGSGFFWQETPPPVAE